MKNLFYILLLFIAFNAKAQVEDTTKKKNIPDTLKKDLFTAPDTVRHLHSKTRSLIPPAILIGYGVSTFYVHPLRRIDYYAYDQANKHDFVPTSHIENVIQYAPPVLVYGLNLIGVHGKNTFIDRTLIYLLAQGMLEATVFGLKHATHRERPNGADDYSFPSGHTANSFAGAEFMAQELSGNSVYYGYLGYALATTTGVFRIYHQDHWLSDVIAGAGFGILSTKAAYLLYPYIRNSITDPKKEEDRHNKDVPVELRKNKPTRSAMLLPSLQQGALGVQFSMQL